MIWEPGQPEGAVLWDYDVPTKEIVADYARDLLLAFAGYCIIFLFLGVITFAWKNVLILTAACLGVSVLICGFFVLMERKRRRYSLTEKGICIARARSILSDRVLFHAYSDIRRLKVKRHSDGRITISIRKAGQLYFDPRNIELYRIPDADTVLNILIPRLPPDTVVRGVQTVKVEEDDR